MASPFHRNCTNTGYQFIDSAQTLAHCPVTFPEHGHTSGYFTPQRECKRRGTGTFTACHPPAKTDGLFTHFHSLQFHLFFCRINRTTPHIFSFHTPFKAVWNSGIPIAYSFAQTEKSLLRVKIQTLPTIPEILLCPQQTSDFSSITQI